METNAFWQLAEWHHPWLATPITPGYDTCSGCIYESSPARVVGFNTDYSHEAFYYEQLPAEAFQAWTPPMTASLESSLGEQLRTLKPIKIAKRSNRGQGRRRNAAQAEQEVSYGCATPNPPEGEVAYGCPTGCPTVATGLLSHFIKAEQCRDSSPAPAPAGAAPEAPTQPIPTPKERRGSADSSPNSAGGFPATPSAPSSPWGSHGTPPRKAVSLFEQLDEAHAAASSAQEQVCSLQQELSKERQEVATLQQQLRLLTLEKERLLAERAAAHATSAAPTGETHPAGGAPAGVRSRRRRRGGRKANGSTSNSNDDNNNNNWAPSAAAAARA